MPKPDVRRMSSARTGRRFRNFFALLPCDVVVVDLPVGRAEAVVAARLAAGRDGREEQFAWRAVGAAFILQVKEHLAGIASAQAPAEVRLVGVNRKIFWMVSVGHALRQARVIERGVEARRSAGRRCRSCMRADEGFVVDGRRAGHELAEAVARDGDLVSVTLVVDAEAHGLHAVLLRDRRLQRDVDFLARQDRLSRR